MVSSAFIEARRFRNAPILHEIVGEIATQCAQADDKRTDEDEDKREEQKGKASRSGVIP